MASPSATTQTQKRSTVRQTRAIPRDRTQRPNSMPLDLQVNERLTEILPPLTLGQVAHFHRLGLPQRLLTLPLMLALGLPMLWRQIGSTCEWVRWLRQEGFLWCSPLQVTEQALSKRLLTFPAARFQRLLDDLLPALHARWADRPRPLPKEIPWVRERQAPVGAVAGSTLDARLRTVGLLRGLERPPLAGRMRALLDLSRRLPRKGWVDDDPKAHDQRFWARLQAALVRGALLLDDLGDPNFSVLRPLTAAGVTWLTRAKSNLAYTLEGTLVHTARVRDPLVGIGSGADRQQARWVAVRVGSTWRRYRTRELDPQRLPAALIVALDGQRWRIEEAYAVGKRLLGRASFWTGSAKGVALPRWAPWLLYAVLIDLTEAVASRLGLPFAALSVEMSYRGIYPFTVAYPQGKTTDPVAYLAENADWLGVIKRKRKRKPPDSALLTNPAGA